MVAFDFSGCGKSEGEYVSLGVHEVADLFAVLIEIKKLFNID
jgi:alpha/beta superfamily hydrolase